MSNENLQQHPFQQHHLSQNDCSRILNKLFYTEQSPQSIDTAFKQIEANLSNFNF